MTEKKQMSTADAQRIARAACGLAQIRDYKLTPEPRAIAAVVTYACSACGMTNARLERKPRPCEWCGAKEPKL